MRPIVYLPPGCPRPAHVTGAPFAAKAPPTGAPFGAGAMYIGVEPPTPAELPEFVDTGAGWWIHIAGRQPRDLLRLGALPGIEIDGAQPGHRWLVPTLLKPGGTPGVGLVSALPCAWRGGRWEPPRHLASIQERLRAVAQQTTLATDAALAELVVDVLAINYHLSMAEIDLAPGGPWLDEATAGAVILAACGVDHGG